MSAARKLPDPRLVPEDTRTREVVRGVEMMSPRPARRHIRTAGHLHTRLEDAFDGPADGGPRLGGWTILFEPEIQLEGDDPLVPDIAGWREQRAPEEDVPDAAYYTAPDFICEVLSPGTKKWDRETKMPHYAFHRVGHLWLVDPTERQLEVYALGRRGWEHLGTHGGDQVVCAEPFEALSLSLSLIWPRRRAP